MNVIDVVEKVIGHVIVMRGEDQEVEVEVIHQEEDIHPVDRDLEVIQVDLVQDPDLDPDLDQVIVVLDQEVIQDPILVIVEVEEDLEVVPYVAPEVIDLALTQEKDLTHQDPNHHVLDLEVDPDPIQNHHHAQDLVLGLVHTVALALVLDHALEVILVLLHVHVHVLVLVLVLDLNQGLLLLNLIHLLEVKMVKNQWKKIKK